MFQVKLHYWRTSKVLARLQGYSLVTCAVAGCFVSDDFTALFLWLLLLLLFLLIFISVWHQVKYYTNILLHV